MCQGSYNCGIPLLVLAITFSSGVAIAMKVAHAKELRLGQFLAVNYLVCSLGLLAWGAWRTLGLNSAFIWLLGISVGGMYVLCLWLFNRAIAAGGLALSTTLMRLSAALPTLGSLMFFAEPANSCRMLGLLMAFLCLPLAGREPLRFGRAGKEAWKSMIWGILLFAAYGITDFAFKVQAELEPLADPNAFMATIFGTALLLTFPQLVRGTRPGRSCLFWGSVLGAANVLATYFWIRTLTYLPGSVAYPTLGLGVITITTLVGLLFWRERLRPANFAFLALACAAVFLINLR
jgi:multidrug transporter EmrE-like cation transporter